MPFGFFKKRPPKTDYKLNIQNYCDFAVQCALRKSDGAILNNFSGDNIRLIIFKDQYGDICDDRIHDRRVIFDSKCVSIEQGSGHQKMSRNQSDHRALLDLVFGNVEMAFRGDCLRIHCTTDPLQLYLSTVFTPTRPRSRESSLSRQNSTSSLASMVVTADDSLCLASAAAPIPMHLVAQYAKDNQITSDTPAMSTSVGTNWLSSLESIRPTNGLSASRSSGNIHQAVSAAPPVGPSGGLRNSGSRLSEALGQKSMSESDSMTSLVSACGRSRRPARLALCVLLSPFPAEEQAAASRFLAQFFANAAVWEFLFFALCREVTDILLSSRHPPVSDVWELLTRFRRGATQVTLGPMLPCPAWLAMISARTVRKDLVRRFASDCLRTVLVLLNTKNTAFFLSTLLTSVLTHHSSWVRSVVSKSLGPKVSRRCRCRCRFAQPCTPTRQIHDLYGCICTGLARVVVIGRDRQLVQLLLHVLTYFLRSGHVRATEVEADEEGPPDNVLPTLSNTEPVTQMPSDQTPIESTNSNSLSDSGLSSQEDLVPCPPRSSQDKKAGDKARSTSQTTRFCEETENGVFLNLPLAERDYAPATPLHASEASHCLLGGVVPDYSSVLALQGLCSASSSSSTGTGAWETDLKRDLRHAVAWSGAPYAVGLVADIDSHSVREVRIEEDFGPEEEAIESAAGPSRCVMSMLEAAQTFLAGESLSDWMVDASLSSVEHSLSQMVCRARALWEIFRSTERLTPIEMKRLGIEMSDMALYKSIALADICIQG